jgi:hypothetical protein
VVCGSVNWIVGCEKNRGRWKNRGRGKNENRVTNGYRRMNTLAIFVVDCKRTRSLMRFPEGGRLGDTMMD